MIVDARTLAPDLKMTEARFQRQVVQLAELLGWRVWQAVVATDEAREPSVGGADLDVPSEPLARPFVVLIRRPRIVWAKVKSERGHLTAAQMVWLVELRSCGQQVYVWRPSDIRKIERTLR